MSLRLSSGIRKNGGTRVYQPQISSLPLRLFPGLPSAAQLQAAGECRGFNRPWMGSRSVRMVEALWAACPSDTTAHQVACQLLIMLQQGVIEIAKDEVAQDEGLI